MHAGAGALEPRYEVAADEALGAGDEGDGVAQWVVPRSTNYDRRRAAPM
jgi:hypothetical protein